MPPPAAPAVVASLLAVYVLRDRSGGVTNVTLPHGGPVDTPPGGLRLRPCLQPPAPAARDAAATTTTAANVTTGVAAGGGGDVQAPAPADRPQGPGVAGGGSSAAPAGQYGSYCLDVPLLAYVDHSVLELFVLGGRGRVTSRVYALDDPRTVAWGLALVGATGAAGGTVEAAAEVWELSGGWLP